MTYRDEFRQVERDTFWSLPRIGLLLAGVIVLLFGLGLLTGVLDLARQPGRVVAKTLDADNMIQQYEWFKQQYQDVQATDVQIADAEKALDALLTRAKATDGHGTTTYQQDVALSEQQRIVTGLKQQRARYVATYNARSQMANRSLFKTHDLPERLD